MSHGRGRAWLGAAPMAAKHAGLRFRAAEPRGHPAGAVRKHGAARSAPHRRAGDRREHRPSGRRAGTRQPPR